MKLKSFSIYRPLTFSVFLLFNSLNLHASDSDIDESDNLRSQSSVRQQIEEEVKNLNVRIYERDRNLLELKAQLEVYGITTEEELYTKLFEKNKADAALKKIGLQVCSLECGNCLDKEKKDDLEALLSPPSRVSDLDVLQKNYTKVIEKYSLRSIAIY